MDLQASRNHCEDLSTSKDQYKNLPTCNDQYEELSTDNAPISKPRQLPQLIRTDRSKMNMFELYLNTTKQVIL